MVHMLMESSVALLEVNDIDHPIKSGSIFCSSALIAYHKDIIDGKHSFKACSLFLTRLRNVVTQVPALLAFKLIFSSPCRSHNAALDSFVSQLFEITPTLLSKKDAFLRHCATSLLASLVEAYGLLVPVESLESVRDLLVSQFSSDDLKLAQLIMKYISSMNIATLSKNYFSDKDLIFFHRFLEFLQEESFPESLSSSAVACFTSFFPANLESSAVDYMLKIISDSLRSNISKTSLSVFSNCIVSVAKNISLLMLINVFNYFLSLLCHSRTTKSLALLVTSELIHEDGSFNDSLNHIKDEAVSMLFESSPTEKFSSVVALKNVLSAAPIEFVSVFTENLSNSNGHIGLTYQVLLSTREAILLYASELYQYSSPLISILLSMVETVDDGIRTLVAECLGILADGHSSIISSVQDMALSSSKEARSFAIMFLRFVLLYKSIDSFQQVNLDLSKFFKTLTDSNMDVVRQALLSLNSIINSNVHFLYQYGKMELQESWIPVLFEHTTPKSEMVKKANFGQFTERMDEHLPVRKAAYICLISLLKKCPHLLQFEKLMESIRPGFEDLENEVQLVAYEVLKYVCGIHPEYVVQYLDSYIPALTTGVKRQLKLVNSDHNALEILSQFVQLMLFLEQIPGVSACRQFSVFREQVLKTKALAPLIKEAKSTLLQN